MKSVMRFLSCIFFSVPKQFHLVVKNPDSPSHWMLDPPSSHSTMRSDVATHDSIAELPAQHKNPNSQVSSVVESFQVCGETSFCEGRVENWNFGDTLKIRALWLKIMLFSKLQTPESEKKSPFQSHIFVRPMSRSFQVKGHSST